MHVSIYPAAKDELTLAVQYYEKTFAYPNAFLSHQVLLVRRGGIAPPLRALSYFTFIPTSTTTHSTKVSNYHLTSADPNVFALDAINFIIFSFFNKQMNNTFTKTVILIDKTISQPFTMIIIKQSMLASNTNPKNRYLRYALPYYPTSKKAMIFSQTIHQITPLYILLPLILR